MFSKRVSVKHKLFLACLLLPALLLVINAAMAFYLLTSFSRAVNSHFQITATADQQENPAFQTTQHALAEMTRQAQLLLGMTTLSSVILVIMVGFLISRQLLRTQPLENEAQE
jgi:hypothetical protein